MSPKHPGASDVEILNEPDWILTHNHRVGTRGREARFMGVTNESDWQYELEKVAEEQLNRLREKVSRGELITVRDVMKNQKVCNLSGFVSFFIFLFVFFFGVVKVTH